MTARSSDSAPGESDIRQALARVSASEPFARSPRLRGLLDYLVNESLAGRGEKIRATSIAIDLFERDETFDQQSDPIVRVEAGRLRSRLQQYYRESGSEDPLLIEIPKGAYVPRFSFRPIETAVEAAPTSSPGALATADGRRNILAAFAAGLVVAVMVISAVMLISPREQHPPEPEPFPFASADARPYIVVNTVAANPEDDRSGRLASGLAEVLITNLSKISGLSVMAHASVLEAHQRGDAIGIAEFRSRFGVTHMFRGTTETDGDRVVINMQLVDARTARVLWAERASRPMSNIIDLEEELALNIARQLAVQLQPGERERLAQLHTTSSDAWLFYRQGLVTIMPPTDLARVQAARQLFDRASQVDSAFAGGHAGHSFAHSTRVLFMNTTDSGWELANAKANARKAISLDPEFGAGYAMMAFANMLADERDEALENARKSVAIQPGDAFARFIIGMSLILSGQPEQSIGHLQEALRLDPLESRMPYLNVLSIAYYASGDYSNALSTIQQNLDRGGPRGPHMALFLAASHAQLGDEESARLHFSDILQKYPGFPSERWLGRWLVDASQLEQTLGLMRSHSQADH